MRRVALEGPGETAQDVKYEPSIPEKRRGGGANNPKLAWSITWGGQSTGRFLAQPNGHLEASRKGRGEKKGSVVGNRHRMWQRELPQNDDMKKGMKSG